MLLQCYDCELKYASSCIIILGVCCSLVLDLKCQEVEPWRISFLFSFRSWFIMQVCVVFTDLQSLVLVILLSFWLVIESSFQNTHRQSRVTSLFVWPHWCDFGELYGIESVSWQTTVYFIPWTQSLFNSCEFEIWDNMLVGWVPK